MFSGLTVLIMIIVAIIVSSFIAYMIMSKKCLFLKKKAIDDSYFSSLLENTSVGLIIKDPVKKVYLYTNKAAQDLLGVSDLAKKEQISKLLQITKTNLQEVEREDKLVIGSGYNVKADRIIYEKDSPVKWLYITKSLIKNEDNKALILLTIEDVTKRNLRRLELENTKAQLSLALSVGGMDAWVFDVAERRFEPLTVSAKDSNLDKQQITLEGFVKYLSKEDVKAIRNDFFEVLRGRQNIMGRVFRVTKGGEDTFYDGRIMSVKSDDGKVIYVVGVRRDITKDIVWQKELNNERIKSEMLFNAARIVLWEYDVQQNLFSSKSPNSFFYTPLSFENYLKIIHPDDVENVKEYFNGMIEDTFYLPSVEYRIMGPIGEYIWCNIQCCVADRAANGRPLKLLGLRREIDTERKHTQNLIELREEADKSNMLKSAYLANMSHEIRTPLNAIVGFSNLMVHIDDQKEKEEYMKIIQTNNDLLLQLISDILDLSKIEAGFLTFNYTDEDVSEIFRQVHASFYSKVKPGVEFKINIPHQRCIIKTDKNRLIQVESNFLSNACKFTNTGSIEMGYQMYDQGIKIYVKDTGIGMTKEQCAKVFERFAKFGKDVVGTGLGMSISDTIIKTFGGKIGVDSELGIGSTFWAQIPCNPITDDSNEYIEQILLPDEDDKIQEQLSEQGERMYNVLVAEDNESNYLLLSSILKKRCNFRWAHDGAECIEMFIAHRPDIIFMDIQMPIMDGYEATKSIREIDKNIPIVAVTANAYDNDRESALAAGCNDYLSKPVNIASLNKALELIK